MSGLITPQESRLLAVERRIARASANVTQLVPQIRALQQGLADDWGTIVIPQSSGLGGVTYAHSIFGVGTIFYQGNSSGYDLWTACVSFTTENHGACSPTVVTTTVKMYLEKISPGSYSYTAAYPGGPGPNFCPLAGPFTCSNDANFNVGMFTAGWGTAQDSPLFAAGYDRDDHLYVGNQTFHPVLFGNAGAGFPNAISVLSFNPLPFSNVTINDSLYGNTTLTYNSNVATSSSWDGTNTFSFSGGGGCAAGSVKIDYHLTYDFTGPGKYVLTVTVHSTGPGSTCPGTSTSSSTVTMTQGSLVASQLNYSHTGSLGTLFVNAYNGASPTYTVT